MTRGRAGLVVALLLGTAPVASAQLVIRQDNPVRVANHWVGQIMLDTLAIWENVPASRARTFAAALAVLDSLEMPFERADSTRSVVYHSRIVARRRFANRALSQMMRCGGGLTGDNADVWRVTLSFAVYVDSIAAEKSRLGVAIFASAMDVQGASKPTIICATRGALEHEITRLVLAAVEPR